MIVGLQKAIVCFFGDNLISWSSKKQHAIASSSTKSKYHALVNGAPKVMWYNPFLLSYESEFLKYRFYGVMIWELGHLQIIMFFMLSLNTLT